MISPVILLILCFLVCGLFLLVTVATLFFQFVLPSLCRDLRELFGRSRDGDAS